MFKFKYILASLIIRLLKKFKILKKINQNCFLLYHSIDNEKNMLPNFLDFIDKKKFKEQCLFLFRNFQNNVTDYESNLKKKGSISLTFDDGYKSILTNVIPIVNNFKFPILIFICPALIGKKGYLDFNDINVLKKNELVSFGIHGYEHIYYGLNNIEKFKSDFIKSLNWYNQYIDQTSNKIIFSFPYGSFNSEIIDYLSKFKNKILCFNSSLSSIDIKNFNKLKIPRISIWNTDSLEQFENKLNGYWNIINSFINNNEKI